jgi:AmiR/NasT family two-component response regulator
MDLKDQGGVADLVALNGALLERVAQLERALETRIVIEQAKGAVAVRCGVTPDVAFQMIRGLARSQRRKLHEFCAEVLENEGRLDGMPHTNGHIPLSLRL